MCKMQSRPMLIALQLFSWLDFIIVKRNIDLVCCDTQPSIK